MLASHTSEMLQSRILFTCRGVLVGLVGGEGEKFGGGFFYLVFFRGLRVSGCIACLIGDRWDIFAHHNATEALKADL